MTTLLSIDQGTTSSRAILFSENGEILAVRQKELPLHYPQKGWVEQDPEDIRDDTLWAARAVLTESGEIPAAVGITNQRETVIVWDRATGRPVYNAIVWQDRRTADLCERLKKGGHEPAVTARTGLLLDPYFSATKLAWILDHVEGARARAERGDLAFGTVDSWLLWNLTGGDIHATDTTNAARTMLFNVRENDWDDRLLSLFNVPRALLPAVHDNTSVFGQTTLLCDRTLAITGMAGDQHAAVIGQACFAEGMVKATYGTGCFALMNIGSNFRESQNRLLTTPAYRLDGRTTYALEGSIFVAGAAIQWLRDNLRLFSDAAESEALATSVSDNNGVYFVPAFTGLGAPYWNPHARAAIIGLTRESNAAHITRAALEAQAYQTRDLMDAMKADAGGLSAEIRADGGLVANGFVCQLIADIIDRPLEIPTVSETTALGAAYLAGLQSGVYRDLDDLAGRWRCDRRFSPALPPAQSAALLDGWRAAIHAVQSVSGA
ncbi:MAG: glycerol kinase GlpK [Alphaproteobacteria bacterium]|nr:glycerol kinase GlpK [Alphaproteobacteria bacterium]